MNAPAFFRNCRLAICIIVIIINRIVMAQAMLKWPCGLMDKALVFGTKDCRLESCQGHLKLSYAARVRRGARRDRQSTGVRSTGVCSTRVRTTGVWSTEVRSTGVRSTEVWSTAQGFCNCSKENR